MLVILVADKVKPTRVGLTLRLLSLTVLSACVNVYDWVSLGYTNILESARACAIICAPIVEASSHYRRSRVWQKQ